METTNYKIEYLNNKYQMADQSHLNPEPFKNWTEPYHSNTDMFGIWIPTVLEKEILYSNDHSQMTKKVDTEDSATRHTRHFNKTFEYDTSPLNTWNPNIQLFKYFFCSVFKWSDHVIRQLNYNYFSL